ncbi:hypothetical protein Micbo1qcDRAFT_210110 [Microdochium bolleyi]|uniref:Uncharacterized protein n=1 Tax=Microdochium bolleyi TaxID=196109 RepID=A0A136IJX8_9PEZI|nr:hypothetical protein Micbo1qcDRAFT_210110 [Microdochium bolleyi]
MPALPVRSDFLPGAWELPQEPSNSKSDPLPDWPVFVDIPDVDNVACCLSMIRRHPGRRINIVLTPRPVDFNTRPYDEAFDMAFDKAKEELMMIIEEPDTELRARLATRIALTPFSTPPYWVEHIKDPVARDYFLRPDKLFRGKGAKNVRKDTRLYIQLSAYRFASFLRDRGIDHSRYRFFWSERSMDSVAPGIRHARHVPDYSFGFDDALSADHAKALKIEDNKKRGEKLRRLCKSYIKAEQKKWAKAGVKRSLIGTFESLMEEQSKVLTADAFVPVTIGGAFTEPLRWIKNEKLPVPPYVNTMTGYIKGGSNIFPNQFNISIDLSSAWAFLKFVQEKKIPTLLVPTEIIKDLPWRLSEEDLKRVFDGHTAVLEAFQKFTSQAKAIGSITLYDWLTVIVLNTLHLLPTRQVVPFVAEPTKTKLKIPEPRGVCTEQDEVDSQPENIPPSSDAPSVILKFKEAEPEQHSYIRMCWTTMFDIDNKPVDPEEAKRQEAADNEMAAAFKEKAVEELRSDLDPSQDRVLDRGDGPEIKWVKYSCVRSGVLGYPFHSRQTPDGHFTAATRLRSIFKLS